jgi:hypothetical protein
MTGRGNLSSKAIVAIARGIESYSQRSWERRARIGMRRGRKEYDEGR